MNRTALSFLATTLAFFACAAPECPSFDDDGVQLRFEVPRSEKDFFSHPWPSNARRRDDGTLQLAAWPNPTESSTLEEYLSIFGEHSFGYGLNSATYFIASDALDESSLSIPELETMSHASVMYLVDIDQHSPEYGRFRPLRFKYYSQASTYLPANAVAALAPFGFTLRSNTTYAVVATNALKANDGRGLATSENFHHAIRKECQSSAAPKLFEMLAPLRAYFDAQDVDRSAVVAATVFTTQDVLGEMQRISESVDAQPMLQLRNLHIVDEREDVVMSSATVQMPSFQSGTVPYQSHGDGGGINWQPDGSVAVHHYETTRMSFILPLRGEMPESGWPVVLMSHGTGASHTTAFARTIASTLAGRGMAVVSYDPTLHGPRDPTGSDERLTFFNLFNVLAARDNVRQGAVDCLMISRLLRSGLQLPAGATRRAYSARFDGERMAFLGHSQGGLAGSPCMAVEPNMKAAVFSGTSGVLNITLQERKAPVDFEALLRSLLALPADEAIDDFHPVLNLFQTFIDPADPISYASAYLSKPPPGLRRDYLFIEGFLDSASPARGHEALATAAGAPLIAPFFRLPAAAALLGPPPLPAPASANVMSANGPITMGLIQYPEQDHWPIFDDFDANKRYAEFLRSALFDGRAQIIATSH
jgi:predicted esterase